MRIQEHPLTVNSKADLAVLQERDEQKEAAQVLKEFLREPHGHDVGIDFVKDLTLSPGPAAAAKDAFVFSLSFCAAICFFPTSLCGVLVFDSVSRSRPLLPAPPPPHTTLSHTLFHTQLCHTPSFTHTTSSHTSFVTQLCHTLAQKCHCELLLWNASCVQKHSNQPDRKW